MAADFWSESSSQLFKSLFRLIKKKTAIKLLLYFKGDTVQMAGYGTTTAGPNNKRREINVVCF